MQKSRIILVGRGASGKDHMRKTLEQRGYKYAVSYTTRPPRPNEIHGKDYIFISIEEAERMIAAGEFYEYVTFNEWIYGTTNEQFYNDDVFIMTPKGLSHLAEEDRRSSFVIFLDINQEIRKRRMLDRNMPGDSVDRRIEADRLDFDDFKNYDIKITNPDF